MHGMSVATAVMAGTSIAPNDTDATLFNIRDWSEFELAKKGRPAFPIVGEPANPCKPEADRNGSRDLQKIKPHAEYPTRATPPNLWGMTTTTAIQRARGLWS